MEELNRVQKQNELGSEQPIAGLNFGNMANERDADGNVIIHSGTGRSYSVTEAELNRLFPAKVIV